MNQATINPLEAVPWSMDSSAPAPNSSYMNLETTQPIPPQTDSLNESAPFDSLMDIPTDFDWVCIFFFSDQGFSSPNCSPAIGRFQYLRSIQDSKWDSIESRYPEFLIVGLWPGAWNLRRMDILES